MRIVFAEFKSNRDFYTYTPIQDYASKYQSEGTTMRLRSELK